MQVDEHLQSQRAALRVFSVAVFNVETDGS